MIVVSDTSPIINLSGIGCLHLLRELYHIVVIPSAVADELGHREGGSPGSEALSFDWVQVIEVETPIHFEEENILDAGEIASIQLSIGLNADFTLMDEQLGRAAAVKMGLRVVGVLGVLVEAKEKGLIREIRPLISDLLAFGFYLKDSVVAAVLRRVGEE